MLGSKQNTIYIEDGHRAYARGDYQKAFSIFNELKKSPMNKDGKVSVYLGNTSLQLELYDESERAFKEALKKNTLSGEALLGLGHAYAAMGKTEDAINSYDKAIEIDSSHVDVGVFSSLGHCMHTKGDFSAAKKYYKKALELSKPDPYLLCYLGNTHFYLKEYDLAKQCYAKAMNSAKGSEDLSAIIKAMVPARKDSFGEHYYGWRMKRIKRIIKHYGLTWFEKKKILELGCGYGDIGMAFVALGADCTFVEARDSHINEMRARYSDYPKEKLLVANLDGPWPFKESFDLVLHLGLLYHLNNWEESIKEVAARSSNMVLETEVCDSDDPDFILQINEEGYDQSFTGIGSRPSGPAVEKILHECGFKFQRLTDDSCNSTPHVYDWKIANTGDHGPAFRRLWFCFKE